MEDLLGGLNDWRNIQDVVRHTFKALHDLLIAQGQKIKELENKLEAKASLQDIRTIELSMCNKPTFNEVHKLTNELSANIFNSTEMDRIRKTLRQKADKSELVDIYSGITVATNTKQTTVEIQNLVHQQQMEITRLKEELAAKMDEAQADKKYSLQSEVSHLLHQKANKKSVFEALAKKVDVEQFDARISEIPDMALLDQVLARKVDTETLVQALQERPQRVEVAELFTAELSKYHDDRSSTSDNVLKEILRLAETKADKTDLNNKVNRQEFLDNCGVKVGTKELETRLAVTTDAIANEVKATITTLQQELVEILNKKAFKADVQKALAKKSNTEEVRALLARKAEVGDVRDALSDKADVVEVHKILKQKTDVNDVDKLRKQVDQLARQVADNMDELRSALETRPTIKDVCKVLDEKASTADVNAALIEVNKQLQRDNAEAQAGPTTEDLKQLHNQLSSIKNVVDCEISVGKWIWKTGRVAADRTVPWNAQVSNTSPDKYIWTKDSGDVVLVVPGLYQIACGFFTERDPCVQILVNSEPIFTGVKARSDSGKHHPTSYKGTGQPGQPNRVIRRGRHSAGNVTGWTLTEYIAVPKRAIVSVLYDGEANAQGFLMLQKI